MVLYAISIKKNPLPNCICILLEHVLTILYIILLMNHKPQLRLFAHNFKFKITTKEIFKWAKAIANSFLPMLSLSNIFFIGIVILKDKTTFFSISNSNIRVSKVNGKKRAYHEGHAKEPIDATKRVKNQLKLH